MMDKPVLLDLFCCAGGAAVGYYRSGFKVLGVDIEPQPNYPCEFFQADALTLVRAWMDEWRIAAIHASPMCQAHSPLNAYNKKQYPDQIAATRALLQSSGRPWIMENVPQAPLRDPTILCGTMFGLRLYRHRAFEASFPLVAPDHPRHVEKCARNGNLPKNWEYMTISGGKHSEAWRRRAAEEMGVPWMRTIREVCEAIPPAYTEYLGRQLMRRVHAATRSAAA